jgi:hypothetical protein
MSSGSDAERWGKPWPKAVREELAGATCLWQDLDGLHVSSAPDEPPPTSIMWGWRQDGTLLRVRLDSDAAGVVAFVARHDPAASGAPVTPAVPWDIRGDRRVFSYRGPGPGPQDGGAGAEYEQVVVDGIEEGAGPVTFLRPAVKSRG